MSTPNPKRSEVIAALLRGAQGRGEEAREGAGGLAPQHIFGVFCFSWAEGSLALPRPVPARAQAGPPRAPMLLGSRQACCG